MAGSVQNIGEQKEAEAQLLHVQRMESVGVLAGGVAHDFNNLLTAIQNYARLSLRYVEQRPDRAREALEGILAAGDRAATLTRQLLAFSRRQIIHRRTLDLNALIAELIGMLRRLIPESISIEFTPGHPLDTVDVDPGQPEQVLVNPCVNARDAMLDGGKLRITTENTALDEEATRLSADSRPGRYVRLTVMDTGLGMSRDVLDRAFEPFFTTKERGKGTGLGLSTVYGIVRQHGGLVDLESYEGAGTAVRVFIPSVEQSARRRENAALRSSQGGSELILVAEDNDLVRRILVQLLEEAGYRVVVARDGIEAIQRFEERPDEFDLLFLDVIMPKMSGRDAYECIRKTHDVKVVFCSGYSGGVFEDEFFRGPHRRLIPKPYDVEVLLSTVRAVLDAP
jgi:nitrogen-specific signal transduction histidine kinase/CheY-like chemotaxis protein